MVETLDIRKSKVYKKNLRKIQILKETGSTKEKVEMKLKSEKLKVYSELI